MSSETRTETATTGRVSSRDWEGGVIGGLVGGIVMGAMIWMMARPIIVGAIPGLYTLQGPVAGWIAHLIHSSIFGLIFVALLQLPALTRYTDSLWISAGLGLIYGAILWVVAAGLVMPLWLQAVGFPKAPPVPNWGLPGSLVPHLVYGVLLGAIYPLFSR